MLNKTRLKFDKQFLRDFWWLFKPYWTSEEKWSAFGLLGLSIFFTVLGVCVSVALNTVTRDFYDALQHLNKDAIIATLLRFGATIAISIFSYGYAFYFHGLLSIRWRRWLTKKFLRQWLHHHTHYKHHSIDNPDQRISEDLTIFPDTTLMITFMLVQSCLTLLSFSHILWNLSGGISIPIGTSSIYIPGYLFFGALFYGVLGVWITVKIGKKLATLDYQQQFFNADFRFSLMRLRESSEEIAMYRGEFKENEKFHHLFNQIFNNFLNIITLKKYLTFFSSGYNTAAYLIGIFMAIPLYLQGKIQLGVLMQISSAFNSIMSSFLMLVNGFSVFAEWRAAVSRLTEFRKTIEKSNKIPSNLVVKEHEHDDIEIRHVNLFLPDGTPLLNRINLTFYSGGTFLISGTSGIGKSTLLKTIATLWPHAEGEIKIPKNKKMFFLPQKPYLPLGSLQEILLYPLQHDVHPENIYQILDRCALEKLKSRLHEVKNWAKEFSLGEQQRIGFVRMFLQNPDIIFLDESTSALDEQTESHIYENIKTYLPQATIISISHRSNLRKFHEHFIVLQKENEVLEKSLTTETLEA